MAKFPALTRVLLFAALAAAFACAPAPRQRPVKMGDVGTGAGSLTEARKYLEGRWTLESFEVHPPGKEPILLKGSGDLDTTITATCGWRSAPRRHRPTFWAAEIDIRDERISSNGRTVVDLQHTDAYLRG